MRTPAGHQSKITMIVDAGDGGAWGAPADEVLAALTLLGWVQDGQTWAEPPTPSHPGVTWNPLAAYEALCRTVEPAFGFVSVDAVNPSELAGYQRLVYEADGFWRLI